jgi:hypothetical protein
MRKFIAVAALAALSLSWSDAAHAGKKSEPAADAGAATTAEAYKMEVTGIAELDSFFSKAQAPLDTLLNARMAIDGVNSALGTSLGLKEGTPLKDALAELKTKAGDSITVAMDGAMPKLTVADAAPADVKAAVEATNTAFKNAATAVAGLAELPAQFEALITEAKGFSDPAKLKGMVSNPTQLPKAVSKVGKNISTLGKAKDEPAALKASVETVVTDTMAAFKK